MASFKTKLNAINSFLKKLNALKMTVAVISRDQRFFKFFYDQTKV